MFNLRNLLCLSASVLLMSASPSIALSSHCDTSVNIKALKGGVVDVVQLRTGIRVEMQGSGHVYLSVSDNQGHNLYSTAVNALERNHFINTESLLPGQYRLTAYTEYGNIIFNFTIN